MYEGVLGWQTSELLIRFFWEDGCIMEQLSHDEKYFLLYLMRNPKSTQLGIYGLPKRVMCFDTGFELETVNGMLDRLEKEHRSIAYDGATQELALLSSLEYSILKGGKPVRDCLER